MEISKIKPTKKGVLIQAYEWPKETKSGIIIPDTVQYSSHLGGRDPWRGKILAVGPDVTQVSVGEIVRYQPNNYNPQTIEEDRVRYILLDELLIYAVEDEQENLLRALKGRFVFLPDKITDKNHCGIVVPQTVEENFLYGTVVVAGEGVPLEGGDRVILENKNTWQYFDSNEQRYILTDVSNVLVQMLDEQEGDIDKLISLKSKD